jgi:predicted polyphosphate/ATP-dependent NAD kinase
MSKVGLIVNPASGKDIRRIVAQGWVVSNQEKEAIVRRVLRGLEAAGVAQVYFMPEPAGICAGAFSDSGLTSLQAVTPDLPVTYRQEDSTAAAAMMAAAGVSCIITLGGDGTNRAVFKGSGPAIPLLPISTGTNNVFPEFQEGTTAGYAAGLLATGRVTLETACWRSKILQVYRDGSLLDLALVDLAVSRNVMIGARAIWQVADLTELFLTRAQPWSIGLSAIGGVIQYVPADSPYGLHLVFGPGGRPVRAPIGPGLFSEISILEKNSLTQGVQVQLNFPQAATLAFDGERDLTAQPGDRFTVELSPNGPWVLEPPRALIAAVTDL